VRKRLSASELLQSPDGRKGHYSATTVKAVSTAFENLTIANREATADSRGQGDPVLELQVSGTVKTHFPSEITAKQFATLPSKIPTQGGCVDRWEIKTCPARDTHGENPPSRTTSLPSGTQRHLHGQQTFFTSL
jgi:hypothetical protein